MRRFASVLSSRRLDKPESQPPPDPSPASPPSSQPNRKSSRRFFGTLTRITVSTERPIRPSEPTHSSSASSTGSVSLRTPEDDRTGHLAPRSPSSRKAWVTWLTPKKPDVQPPIRPSSFRSDSSSPVPSPQPAPPRIIPGQQSESEEDTSEESSSSESDIPSQSPPIAARSHQVNRSLTPIEFLQTLTTNNILPPLSPPPLLHCPNAPLFPRSSNVSRSLPFRDTVEAAMHRTRLLHRLERGPLTPADQRLLARLGYRTSSVAERRTLVQPEEWERYDLRHVRPSSLGLKQWIARPYFEERSVVWVPDETGTVVWTTIQGSGFGVWALEVSDRIELMADLVSDGEDMSTVGMLAARSPSNSAVPPSLSAVGKLVPYKAVPSPLRSDTTPTDPPMSSSSSEFMPTTSAVSSPRRGVRFADNLDKEDQVPLGYVLRHRKRREEKTLFIQREQERREHEEEKRRHEAERQQWEQEKRQWQKEKRSIEEAKRQKQYAEEINAARVRRETLYVLPSSQAREQDRKPREAYSRPVYDPRRQIEPLSQAHQPHPRNDSSSSSKQGNLPQSESAGLLTSRPASTHSIASSEDIRSRVSRNSRRGSMISESSQRSVTSPIITYGWPPVPPIPQVLPMPIFPSIQAMPITPQFPMDMPLLPPAAPFMRQQYDRSHSRASTPSRGFGSRSAERSAQPHSTDRASPRSHHRRSSSDDYGGRKARSPSHTQTNNSLAPPRPLSPMRASSSDVSHRASMPSPMQRTPYAPRRQTAIS